MLKPVHWLGLSLTLAGICALPALADGMDAPKTDGSAQAPSGDAPAGSQAAPNGQAKPAASPATPKAGE